MTPQEKCQPLAVSLRLHRPTIIAGAHIVAPKRRYRPLWLSTWWSRECPVSHPATMILSRLRNTQNVQVHPKLSTHGGWTLHAHKNTWPRIPTGVEAGTPLCNSSLSTVKCAQYMWCMRMKRPRRAEKQAAAGLGPSLQHFNTRLSTAVGPPAAKTHWRTETDVWCCPLRDEARRAGVVSEQQ